MNHTEQTKELLFNEGGLHKAQQQKAKLQLRRDGKPESKRPLTWAYTRKGPGCWNLRRKVLALHSGGLVPDGAGAVWDQMKVRTTMIDV